MTVFKIQKYELFQKDLSSRTYFVTDTIRAVRLGLTTEIITFKELQAIKKTL